MCAPHERYAQQEKELLKAVVDLYNNERPHMSIGNFTPNYIHQSITNIKTEKLWKNYYRKQTTFVKGTSNYLFCIQRLEKMDLDEA